MSGRPFFGFPTTMTFAFGLIASFSVASIPFHSSSCALIPAATLRWIRLVAASVLAGGLTAAAQGSSHSVWVWWVPLVIGLAGMLALSRPRVGHAADRSTELTPTASPETV